MNQYTPQIDLESYNRTLLKVLNTVTLERQPELRVETNFHIIDILNDSFEDLRHLIYKEIAILIVELEDSETDKSQISSIKTLDTSVVETWNRVKQAIKAKDTYNL